MGRKIWIMNHYASNMFFDQGGRHYAFAKYMKRLGEEPVVFCCNSVHNGNGLYFQDNSLWHHHIAKEIGVPFVFVRGRPYIGNGMGRILNMVDFYRNVKMAAKEYASAYGCPNIIYASSVHPLTLMAGIQLAKIFQVKCICEIRDLWPESFVAYGFVKKSNPVLFLMRLFEKKIYEAADVIVFLQEGAYDYILERGWEEDIPKLKTCYINNGTDLEDFEYNRQHYQVEDADLQNEEIFKIVYSGSIRRVNDLGKLLDIAKQIKNPKIKFLIWGKGDELSSLKKRVLDENIRNVEFKGFVDKKYIPYITSHADLNIMHNTPSSIWRFGPSLNKMFDYMAAGKPVLTDFPCNYNPLVAYDAGVEVSNPTVERIAHTIEEFANLDAEVYSRYCMNSRRGAEQFDFKNLTKKIIQIMTGD